MKNSTNKFLNLLSSHNIRYSIVKDNGYTNEPDIITVGNNGKNMQNMLLCILMSDKDVSMYIRIAEVPYEKKQLLYSELNSINNEYRFTKFHINNENYLHAQLDFIFTQDSAAEICLDACIRIINIVDRCYPRIMKCLW